MGIYYHLLTPLLFTHPTGATGRQALVIYINIIRMFVCLSVCLYVNYILGDEGGWVKSVNADGWVIYRSRSSLCFFIFPDNCPDAIVRKPDTVEKKRPKIAYFWRFLDHLTHFPF